MNVASGELLVVDLSDSGSEHHMPVIKYLADSGLDSTLVVTKDACLEQIQNFTPVLVVYFLWKSQPAIEPSEFIQTIKRKLPNVPIIAIAPFSETGLLQPALVKGADDYLFSPVQDFQLLDHLVGKNIRLGKERNTRLVEGQRLVKLNKELEESLRILEHDQRAGFQVQRGMMPESPCALGDVVYTHKIIPSVILSGDFIDYFEIPDDRQLFYIADVSGHGASSAFITVLLKNLSQRLMREFDQLGFASTAEILQWFNDELLSSDLEHHVTMFLGIIDTCSGELEYSNAAHFPGTIISSKDATEFLEIGGLPLGLYDSASYETYRIQLPAEFTLVMFSDGIFEVMDQQTLKAKEEFLLTTIGSGKFTVEEISEQLGLAAIADAPDDIALFTIARAA